MLATLVATFLFASTALAAGGCGKTSIVTPGRTGTVFTIPNTSGGSPTTRSFIVDVPKGYNVNTAAPLIFSFHGHGKTDTNQEALSEFSDPFFNTKAIAVYPQGVDNQWQGDPRAPAAISDIDFTSKMITNLTATFCIDSTRIYAAGKSNGGGFVNQIACSSLGAKFAAFAPVSGAFYSSGTTGCDANFSRHPTPLLDFHGDADTTIPYTGGNNGNGDLPSIPDFMAAWAKRNACTTSTVDNLFSNTVVRTRWDCGGDLAVLQHYKEIGQPHAWPSTLPNSDNPHGHTKFNGTSVIMDFFNLYSL